MREAKRGHLLSILVGMLIVLVGCGAGNTNSLPSQSASIAVTTPPTTGEVTTVATKEQQTEELTTVATEDSTTEEAKKLTERLKLYSEQFEIQIMSISTMNEIKPPKPARFYHYYTAPNGKTFIVVKIKAKNISDSKVAIDEIGSAHCVYKDKYNYSGFCVFETNGGEDLSNYTTIYGVDPLDTAVCYYLIEIPKEAKNGPYIVTFFFNGENYEFKK